MGIGREMEEEDFEERERERHANCKAARGG